MTGKRLFAVEYTVTEVTRQRILIEADSAEEARLAVETYEFDNTNQQQIDSYRWEVSDVEVNNG